MSSLRLATASNVRAFQNLITVLSASTREGMNKIDDEALEDEFGRFRVWAGNLGALQKGHSSLDYRLRDAPVSNTNVLKLLDELAHNVNEAYAVLSGARLPYEEQVTTNPAEEDDNDDGFFSEEEDEDSDCDEPRSELKVRFEEIIDIIDNLYKLSVRIRTPGIRSRSLRASSYTQKDPETGVDIFDVYAAQDLNHVRELLSHLRQSYVEDGQAEQDFLTTRLSASITLRRRHFKYWKRHRDKLSASTTSEEIQDPGVIAELKKPDAALMDASELPPTTPVITALRATPSQKTGRTLLSGTEVTRHHQSLDDIVDTKSVTSYAVTVKDVHGKGVDLPPPPKAAASDKDFECPYCWIVCPARYGKGRAWKMHLLQDLQPYSCTYSECANPDLLFRSRREWAEHEASHRKVWRCPEHPAAVYDSQSGLESHLRQKHLDSIPENEIGTIVEVGEATTLDMRTRCPICYASADTEGLGDFQHHIANHLERIATFALPHSREDESDGASSVASRGSSDSELLDSLPNDATNGRDDEETDDYTTSQPAHQKLIRMVDPGRGVLSAESLQQLPDDSQNRLNMVQDQIQDGSNSHDEEFDQPSEKQTTLGVDQIPTLRSLYRSRRLLQRDQSYAPNDLYNRLISFCYYDLTKLKVDAIVNNAPSDLKRSPALGTLHHAVMKAGGPKLVQEANSERELKTGQVSLTEGHDLPSSWILHAVGPSYIGSKGVSQFNVLGDCYRNALNKARSSDIRTIAFPCLCSGGAGFSPREASRIALQEVRDYLDAHWEHRFERIIFCVYSAADAKAYTDYFPVFFPPTHGDLDAAKASDWSVNRAALAAQILETWAQVQKVTTELSNEFGAIVSKLETDHLRLLRGIDSAIASLRRHLLGPTKIERSLGDLSLLCSVLQMFCSSLADMNERAKDVTRTKKILQKIWKEENTRMHAAHGANLGQFLEYCLVFANSLDDVLTRKRDEWDLIPAVRQILENYRVKEKGQDAGGIRDHLDKEMYVRRSPPTAPNSKDLIKLQQIMSVANLYQLGDLESKPTMAQPSIAFNQTVCLVREDITKLDVDVIVNSTDPHFLGMGTLDRTIFKKGGQELLDEVKSFGGCQAGEVKTTPGYLLPAKHILHAIPPGLLKKDTKNTLRSIYRRILHNATFLGAKSVAIPSIGTGSLNYPRREGASLAMEEVKRFLESRKQGGLEKIVFVVISSSDEGIYKSLLPVYFPPTQNKDSIQSSGHPLGTPKISSSKPLPDTGKSLSSSRDNTLGNVLGNEHLAVMTAKVFVSNISPPNSSWTPQFFADDSAEPFPSRFWTPVSQNYCIIHVLGSSVNIYEASERGDGFFLPDSKPITSFELVPTSTAQLDTNPSAATLMHVRRASSIPEERATASFFCNEAIDSRALFSTFERALKRTRRQSQVREEAHPKDALTNPETSPEGAGDTTSSAEDPAGISAESKLRVEGTQDTLSTKVLDYLTNDFNSRPGSYIGQNISDIAAALSSDPVTIFSTLEELAAQKKVHSTIDKDTWVISDPPRTTTVKPSLYQQFHHTIPLATRILAYMAREDRNPEERKGLTIEELAEALRDTSAGVKPAIMALVSQHQIDSSNDPEKWTLTPLGEQAGYAINAEKKRNSKELDPSAEVTTREMQPGNTLADRVLSTLRKWPEGRRDPEALGSELDTPLAAITPVLYELKERGLLDLGEDEQWIALRSDEIAPKGLYESAFRNQLATMPWETWKKVDEPAAASDVATLVAKSDTESDVDEFSMKYVTWENEGGKPLTIVGSHLHLIEPEVLGIGHTFNDAGFVTIEGHLSEGEIRSLLKLSQEYRDAKANPGRTDVPYTFTTLEEDPLVSPLPESSFPDIPWRPDIKISDIPWRQYVFVFHFRLGIIWTGFDKRIVVREFMPSDSEDKGDWIVLRRFLSKKEIYRILERSRERQIQLRRDTLSSTISRQREDIYDDWPLDLSAINVKDYIYDVPSHKDWTRIDTRLVSLWALRKVGEQFKAMGDTVVVRRAVGLDEIKTWAKMTDEWRRRSPFEKMALTLGPMPGDANFRPEEPARGKTEPGTSTVSHGGGWRDGKGEKARKQARSSKALAGDIKEDEMEYYEHDAEE